MLRKIFSRIAIIFILAIFPTFLYAKKTAIQQEYLFYRNPSFNKFIEITTYNYSPQIKDMMFAFSLMALNKHPEYSPLIVKNFKNYSDKSKKLLFDALEASGNTQAAKTIVSTLHYKTKITSLYSASDIKNLKIKEVTDLPRVWAAFFATGDDVYLIKSLEFINQNDALLVMGYEINNRIYLGEAKHYFSGKPQKKDPYADIYRALKKQYPRNTENMMHQLSVVARTLDLLEISRHQDNVINKKAAKLIAEHPKWDYVKKIKRVVG